MGPPFSASLASSGEGMGRDVNLRRRPAGGDAPARSGLRPSVTGRGPVGLERGAGPVPGPAAGRARGRPARSGVAQTTGAGVLVGAGTAGTTPFHRAAGAV